MTLGRRIKTLRQAKNLSCSELGRRTGINRGTLAQIECGQHAGLKLSQGIAIARVLGVTVETLADETISTDAILLSRELVTAKMRVTELRAKLEMELRLKSLPAEMLKSIPATMQGDMGPQHPDFKAG